MLPKHPTSGKASTYGISIKLKQPIKLKVIQYTLIITFTKILPRDSEQTAHKD